MGKKSNWAKISYDMEGTSERDEEIAQLRVQFEFMTTEKREASNALVDEGNELNACQQQLAEAEAKVAFLIDKAGDLALELGEYKAKGEKLRKAEEVLAHTVWKCNLCGYISDKDGMITHLLEHDILCVNTDYNHMWLEKS